MTPPDNDSSTPDDSPQKQAWVWLRLLHSGEVRPWDAKAFKRWLSASPAHRAAFHEAKQRWQLMQSATVDLVRTDAEAASARTTPRRRPDAGRRAFFGAALGAGTAMAMVAVFAPAGLWPAPREWGADDRTVTGEQRTLQLDARVRVTLNTQTSIRRLNDGPRATGLELLSGEAAIDLPEKSVAFEVIAGVGRSQALGGRFEVRHLAGHVCVTCVDGEVRVSHPAGARVLSARQQLVYDAASMGTVAVVEPASVSAWRSGELVFARTRLADVLHEINRYRPGHIMLLNDAVAAKPVSGSFFVASLDEALAQLQHTFDLKVRSLPGGVVILS